jgi:type I restriction enzyme S subunit
MLRSQVLNNDVLLNITGASIGRCCPVPVGFPQANVNQHVCIIRLRNTSEFDAYYLATIFNSSIGQQQIKALNAGGNREGLNYQQIKTIVVPMPLEEDERKAISTKLKIQSKLIEDEKARLAKLKKIRAGLMHDLLTGKVSVKKLLESQHCTVQA